MARPTNPARKEELLERCFEVALKEGSFDISLSVYAAGADTSPRMLVHHFGSKDALMAALEARFDAQGEADFARFEQEQGADPASLERVFLALWEHITSPEMAPMARLAQNELSRRLTGSSEGSRRAAVAQTRRWVTFLETRLPDPGTAAVLLMLLQGALVNAFETGDTALGRAAITTFFERWPRRSV